MLNARRERECVLHRTASNDLKLNDALKRFLEGIRDEQVGVYKKMVLSMDQTLGLKHLMRISSQLLDMKKCDEYLRLARMCEGFGATPEERDKAMRKFLDAGRDKDNDLKFLRRIAGHD